MTAEPDAVAGRMVDGVHIWPVRVYYEDTDAAGIVYHANYLRFAERGRTEMLRQAGLAHTGLKEDAGVVFTVRSCQVDFLAPARLDDLVEVHTGLLALGGASMRAEQLIRRAGAILARIELRLACVDGRGRPARLPAPLNRALKPFFRSEPPD